jgi:hypothetical protein
MAWLPDIIGTAYVITAAVNIVRAIANFDCNRAGITAIIRTATTIRAAVVRSVPRISSVIVRTSTEANRSAA